MISKIKNDILRELSQDKAFRVVFIKILLPDLIKELEKEGMKIQ